jgi:hypothetical protein
MEASQKTDENSQISFAFIDKTPSKDSLAIPYCPPMKIDYEDFTSLIDSSEDWAILITEKSIENHKSELVILPVEDSATEFPDRPFPSPAIPLFTTNNLVSKNCQTLSTPAVYTSVQQIHIKSSNQGILFFILYLPFFFKTMIAVMLET